MIRGHLTGSVRALRVTLQSMAHVEGDIYHQSLAMEQAPSSRVGRIALITPCRLIAMLSRMEPWPRHYRPWSGPGPRKEKPTHTFNRTLSESHNV